MYDAKSMLSGRDDLFQSTNCKNQQIILVEDKRTDYQTVSVSPLGGSFFFKFPNHNLMGRIEETPDIFDTKAESSRGGPGTLNMGGSIGETPDIFGYPTEKKSSLPVNKKEVKFILDSNHI